MQIKIMLTGLLTCLLAACGGLDETAEELSAPGGRAELLPQELPLPQIDRMNLEVLGSPGDTFPVLGIHVCNHRDHATLPVELHTFFSVSQSPEEFARLLAGGKLPEADSILRLESLATRAEKAELLEEGELPCKIAIVAIGGREMARYKINEGEHQAWAVLVLSPGYTLPGAWRLAYSDMQLGEIFEGAPQNPEPRSK